MRGSVSCGGPGADVVMPTQPADEELILDTIAVPPRANIVTRNPRHFEDLPVALIDPWTVKASR